jgi:large subunit ribosomal protein L13
MAGQPKGMTRSAKPGDVPEHWLLVDATDEVLGRLASRIAHRLRGKHHPLYTPHADTGDFIIVVNAEKVKLTGNKREDKLYYRHTGWIGSTRSTTPARILEGKHPERVIEHAVRGMLPKNTLGRKLLKKLKIYAGPAHPHAAQQPEEIRLA